MKGKKIPWKLYRKKKPLGEGSSKTRVTLIPRPWDVRVQEGKKGTGAKRGEGGLKGPAGV